MQYTNTRTYISNNSIDSPFRENVVSFDMATVEKLICTTRRVGRPRNDDERINLGFHVRMLTKQHSLTNTSNENIQLILKELGLHRRYTDKIKSLLRHAVASNKSPPI